MKSSESGSDRGLKLVLLEALRGLAASYVVLHHFGHVMLRTQHPSLAPLFAFGQVAVMLFFILSGFVIFYSTAAQQRMPTFGDYFLRRFRRIYPIFFIALVLSYVCSSIADGRVAAVEPTTLLGNLLLLQDYGKAGNWIEPYHSNSPLWSLSYEWFFYMAFFPIAKLLQAKPAAQQYVAGAIGLLGFALHIFIPNQLSLFTIYFILWWVGVEIAREYCRGGSFRWQALVPTLCMIVCFTLLWGALLLRARRAGPDGIAPQLELRHFLTTLAVLAVGATWWKLGFPGARPLRQLFAPLAGISYAMYVLHLPLMLLALKRPLTSSVTLDFLLWVLPTLLVLSFLTEQRLQPVLNRLLSTRSDRPRDRDRQTATAPGKP